jgi:AcrR family transcriptional regulator
MERKPPRRTRERILELSLRLLNDYGEPNVNTTIIAEQMRISPGNLYYHFEKEIDKLLTVPAGTRPPNVEDAWFFLHLLFELIFRYRFIYRDLNNLLINSRALELRFKALLEQKISMTRWLCAGLARHGALKAGPAEVESLATNMVVVTTWWLSYAHVRDPRHFAEPEVASKILAQGCYQVMALTAPYLSGDARQLFEKLSAEYLTA